MTGKQFAAWVEFVGGWQQAREILGVSRATLFRLMKQGRVPRIVRLAIAGHTEATKQALATSATACRAHAGG